MRLIRKIQFTVLILSIILLIVLSFISHGALMNSFIQLEKDYAHRYTSEARNVLTNLISELNTKTADWANWDDTYKFIQDGNEAYIKSNLSESAFSGLQVDIMLFLDSSGKVIYAKYFDVDKKKELPVPPSLLKEVKPASPLLRHTSTESIFSGILLLPEGALLVSSRPILTSEVKGPIKGTLIFGRWIDAKETQHISETVHLPVSIYRLIDNKGFNKNQDIITRAVDKKIITGYGLIKDIYGKPALVMRVDMTRDILKLGQNTVSHYIILQILVYIFFAFILYWIINLTVLKRLSVIFDVVESISKTGDSSQKIALKGNDEIVQLGLGINRMLEKLRTMQDELGQEKSRYQLLADNATDVIWTTDMLLRLTYLSPAFDKISGGYKIEDFLGHAVGELVTADSLKKAREVFLEELANENRPGMDPKRTRALEVEHLRKDGSSFWAEMHMSFLRKPDNTPYGILGMTRDITDRKKAQEILKESEERYRLLFESSRDALMVIMSPEWKFTRANQATLSMFLAKNESEFLNLGPWEVSPQYQPDGRLSSDKAKEMIETAVQKGSYFFEWTHQRLNGEPFPAEVLLTRMELGGQTLVQATVRDISERKKADEINQRFTSIVNSSEDAIISKDLNGIITSWNSGAEKIYGYSFREVKGKSISILIPQGRADDITEILEKIKYGQAVAHYETKRITKYGREIDVSLTVSPIKDTAGNIIGASTIARDITENKKAADIIANAAREWSATFDSMTDGVSIHDANFNIINANSALCKLLGKTKEEIINKKCFQVFHNTSAPIDQCPAVKARDSLKDEYAELFEAHLNRWLAVSVSCVRDTAGNISRVIHVVRDITARKKAEEELKAAYLNLKNMQAELVQAKKMEAVATLASGVAHEVKNPLAIIMQGVSYLEKQIGQKKEAAETFQIIKNGVERADRIVESMADFSRITGLE
ncbi:MAG: PAS domain S-box protein, partial [Candidatus Omnitrophica bacterium]|nr:PAS domain S-box protein [Candidatus Omnitrophota bacterium]